MGTTRTNFYKNPSFSYKKDFSLSSVLQNLKAYNIATGNAPLIQESAPSDENKRQKKRRSDQKREPDDDGDDRRSDDDKSDRPVSHQNYIEKRRKEVGSCHANQKFDPDVLENTSSSFQLLVQYESDEDSVTVEHKEEQDISSSDHADEGDHVKKRAEQRFPVPGDPVCVICGKYGEYICDETGDDICSIDCKTELLRTRNMDLFERATDGQDSLSCFSGSERTLLMPECKEDTWDFDRHQCTRKRSSLCAYECWRCQRPGHLAEDCLVSLEVHNDSSITKDLRELYRRSHQIGKNLSDARCNTCRGSSSLAMCLDCSMILCDSAGHLNEHILKQPSHRQFYSYKLQRLVKCCKSTCNVTDIKDLLACNYCLDKAFDKFYDMYTATWKPAGLSIIWGSICCNEHFTWHRMNCMSADVEGSAYVIGSHSKRDKCVQLNDFIF